MTITEKVKEFGLMPSSDYTGDEFSQEVLEKMEVAYVLDKEDKFFLFTKEGLDKLDEKTLRELIGSENK